MEVIIPLPLAPLAYCYPFPIEPGVRVIVSVQKRTLVGIVRRSYPLDQPVSGLKAVEKILEDFPLVPKDLLAFLEWVADYYFYPLGKVLKTALPPFFWRRPGPRTKPLPPPQSPQKGETEGPLGPRVEVYAQLGYSKRLDHYIEAATSVLAKGQSVLFLVPEIVDFERIYQGLSKVFGANIFPYASHLPAGKRKQTWLAALSSPPAVFLGLKSAVFLPLRPGLIIVEKEASGAYGQEEGLLYQARNLALVRAQRAKAKIILGGALPSVSSFYRVLTGQYILTKTRTTPEKKPRVSIIDLSSQRGYLSKNLLNALKITLGHGQKALLFLNRRGFAPVLRCENCGYVWRCPKCDFALTYHRQEDSLRCHLCGLSLPALPLCPECGQEKVHFLGAGTERLQDVLLRLFPGVNILRVDHETAGTPKKLASIRKRLPLAEIIIGTRLIRRLGPISSLGLIGVVLADKGLHFPDYRAPERTLEILIDLYEALPPQGRFILQTFLPEHYVIQAFARKKFELFFTEELKRRKSLNFPPFSRLFLLELRGRDPQKVEEAAFKVQTLLEDQGPEILGPSPAPFYHIKGFYRWMILLKHKRLVVLQETIKKIADSVAYKGVKLLIFPDPVEIL